MLKEFLSLTSKYNDELCIFIAIVMLIVLNQAVDSVAWYVLVMALINLIVQFYRYFKNRNWLNGLGN